MNLTAWLSWEKLILGVCVWTLGWGRQDGGMKTVFRLSSDQETEKKNTAYFLGD